MMHKTAMYYSCQNNSAIPDNISRIIRAKENDSSMLSWITVGTLCPVLVIIDKKNAKEMENGFIEKCKVEMCDH